MNKRVADENLRNPVPPSLYVETPDSGQIPGTVSILTALEPGRLRSASIWKWGVMAVLLMAAVVAVTSSRIKSTDPISPAMAVAQPVTIPPVAAREESAVAMIVSEQPDTNPTQQKVQGSDEQTVAAPLQAKDSEKTPAKNPSRRKTSDVKKAETKAASVAPQSASKHNKDKDVDLIAALLTHVAQTGKENTAQKPANASGAARSSTPTLVNVKEKDPEHNRDIVARTPGESTESLVKRCLALGFFEGELCRMRICSGLWGKDPACPSSTHTASN